MKKHRLIKYAYDKYPKGLEVISPISGHDKFTCTGGYFFDSLGAIIDGNGWNALYNPSTNKWAEVVEKKEPLLISEDNVQLYEGDKPCWVLNVNGEYKISLEANIIAKGNICCAPHYKIFSTKEAAEAWIECANENLQNYQIESLTDKKGYLFVVNHKGTLVTYIAKDKQEAEGFADLWKGFNYTINEITLPKEQ